MRVFIIIPAYNEEKVIRETVREVKKYVDEVVVVDDGSNDGTAEKARGEGAVVIEHIINRGQGAALKTGFEYALEQGADVVVSFDADGQHNTSEISEMLKPVLSGEVDVSLGSRFLKKSKIPITKKIVLKLGTLFTRLITNLKITDSHNGFRAFNRSALSKINITQDRMAHASQILEEIARLNLRYKEVPVTINYTEYSMAKGQKIRRTLGEFLKFFVGKITM
jgi:glycosyltransferase involved in cell wall biosynthesis